MKLKQTTTPSSAAAYKITPRFIARAYSQIKVPPHQHESPVLTHCLDCRSDSKQVPDDSSECVSCGGMNTVVYLPPCCYERLRQ